MWLLYARGVGLRVTVKVVLDAKQKYYENPEECGLSKYIDRLAGSLYGLN